MKFVDLWKKSEQVFVAFKTKNEIELFFNNEEAKNTIENCDKEKELAFNNFDILGCNQEKPLLYSNKKMFSIKSNNKKILSLI